MNSKPVDVTVHLAPALYLVIYVWHVYWVIGIAETSPSKREQGLHCVAAPSSPTAM